MTPQPDYQPQDHSQFNPFDEAVEEPVQERNRQGEAIIGEIDDVLNGMSDSDDDNEYQSFV